MSLVGKIAERESRKSGLKQSQQTPHAPINVIIKQHFPNENAVTVQVIGGATSQFAQSVKDGDVDRKFPLGGNCHAILANEGANLAGEQGLLIFTGWQLKKGYVTIAFKAGQSNTASYSPIRGSWLI